MPAAQSPILSSLWKEGSFSEFQLFINRTLSDMQAIANKVVFCTGGSGTICSGQVRALVSLGADACIVGRNTEKAQRVASDISSVRPGSKVLGIGQVDVRNFDAVKAAADRCVTELGGIDFVM